MNLPFFLIRWKNFRCLNLYFFSEIMLEISTDRRFWVHDITKRQPKDLTTKPTQRQINANFLFNLQHLKSPDLFEDNSWRLDKARVNARHYFHICYLKSFHLFFATRKLKIRMQLSYCLHCNASEWWNKYNFSWSN